MTRFEIKAIARERLGGRIFGNNWMMALLICVIVTAICGIAGSIIPGIGAVIVIGPMMYAQCLIFLNLARNGGAAEYRDLFRGFTDDFGQNFLIGLLTQIFAFLWGLLFVIPGIVKSYAYSMAYYVKAENPDYDWRQCINESTELMRGHKWDLFVLDLSFLGWYIVGSLCLGVGTLWVVPYHMEARAVFYDDIRAGAPGTDRGYVSGSAGGNSWYQS